MSRAKNWVWTLNNYTSEEEALLSNLVSENETVAFVSWGRETGDSGTPHLQGHLELTRQLRLSQVKRLLGNRVHLEVRRGTFEQAQEYVEKDGDVQTFGQRISTGRGSRTDLNRLAEDIRSGLPRRQLAETYGREFIQYARGIDAYFNIFQRRSFNIFHGPFRWNINLVQGGSQIWWGPPGIGKTEYAKYVLPNALFVSHLDDLALFNEDYEGIIFDDMSFVHMPRTAQIHLLDHENDRSIHIRYRTALIPAHTTKIFLTNETDGFIFNLNDGAIARRVSIEHLE